ncbi:UPF0149 family protein [Azoarcus sp. TTM-91]|uniref:YecA/YgfB family protein n=1 Tax=Azoarcus sp. TTM-91 TaxID=2691581 RepID=UPI00145ED864|nr:YecA family protein [Azoarcus sp. TTM-91]NMG36287.1 UPF0149 family protein [Azoarcus sp. TTM-91]
MSTDNPHAMSDEDFEALEEILSSDIVPEDCMDLEMLDGFLAGVLISPQPVPVERWLPVVWSAHEDGVSFGSGSGVQRAIRLVLSYYNEMVGSFGEEDLWEPFCFAIAEGDPLKLGEEWIEGFTQGLELWPGNWETLVPEQEVEAVRNLIDEMLAPWAEEKAGEAKDETRLGWLEVTGEGVLDIFDCWRAVGLPAPQQVAVEVPAAPKAAGPGRNEACPCGSGKKYKKCCGAT